MKLDPIVLAALVALIKVLLERFLPGVPISDELIYTVLVILLGWLGLEAVKVGAARFLPKYRGLLGK